MNAADVDVTNLCEGFFSSSMYQESDRDEYMDELAQQYIRDDGLTRRGNEICTMDGFIEVSQELTDNFMFLFSIIIASVSLVIPPKASVAMCYSWEYVLAIPDTGGYIWASVYYFLLDLSHVQDNAERFCDTSKAIYVRMQTFFLWNDAIREVLGDPLGEQNESGICSVAKA
jgi:hypothetical protein